jgi:HPt (histidine-containing phosphotransfer) domain-containing protein
MIKKKANIDALLATIWERNLPTLYERLDKLDRIAEEAASGKLTEMKCEEAFNIAHKLAGTLGMFGYHQGTEIARQIEQILDSPTPETSARLTTLITDLRKVIPTSSKND